MSRFISIHTGNGHPPVPSRENNCQYPQHHTNHLYNIIVSYYFLFLTKVVKISSCNCKNSTSVIDLLVLELLEEFRL